MNHALIDHYRFPPELIHLRALGELSKERGYFRFSPETVCFGRSSLQVSRQAHPGMGDDAIQHVRNEGGQWRVEGPGKERARVAYARLTDDEVKFEIAGDTIPGAHLSPRFHSVSNSAPRSPLNVLAISYSDYESNGRVRKYAESLAERGDHVDVISLGKKE